MTSRISAALLLYAFAILGLFLVLAPWTPLWATVAYGWLPDPFEGWMLSGWIRGVVTGLGALDLLVALQVGKELWARSDDEAGSFS